MTIEEQVQARTQQILADRIGQLLIGNARLQAEKDVAAATEARGTTGAQGAEQRPEVSHG